MQAQLDGAARRRALARLEAPARRRLPAARRTAWRRPSASLLAAVARAVLERRSRRPARHSSSRPYRALARAGVRGSSWPRRKPDPRHRPSSAAPAARRCSSPTAWAVRRRRPGVRDRARRRRRRRRCPGRTSSPTRASGRSSRRRDRPTPGREQPREPPDAVRERPGRRPDRARRSSCATTRRATPGRRRPGRMPRATQASGSLRRPPRRRPDALLARSRTASATTSTSSWTRTTRSSSRCSRSPTRATGARRLSVFAYNEWVARSAARRASRATSSPSSTQRRGAVFARNPYNTRVRRARRLRRTPASRRAPRPATAPRSSAATARCAPGGARARAALAAASARGSIPARRCTSPSSWRRARRAPVVFLLGQGGGRGARPRRSSARTASSAAAERGARDGVRRGLGRDARDAIAGAHAGRLVRRADEPLAALPGRRAAGSGRASGYYQPGGAFGFRDQLQDVLALALAAARPRARAPAARRRAASSSRATSSTGGTRRAAAARARAAPTTCSGCRYAVAHYVRATGDAAVLDETRAVPRGAARSRRTRTRPTSQPARVRRSGHRSSSTACAPSTGRSTVGAPRPAADGQRRLERRHEPRRAGRAAARAPGSASSCTASSATSRRCATRAATRTRAERYRPRGRPARGDARSWPGTASGTGAATTTTARRSARRRTTSAGSTRIAAVLGGALGGRAARVRATAPWTPCARTWCGADPRLLAAAHARPSTSRRRTRATSRAIRPACARTAGSTPTPPSWVVMAVARARAAATRRSSSSTCSIPINHARTRRRRRALQGRAVRRSPATSTRIPPHAGRGGWTWYTGSAGWMYRAGLESILGLRRRGATFALDPCIPASWPGYAIAWRFGGTRYEIHGREPGAALPGRRRGRARRRPRRPGRDPAARRRRAARAESRARRTQHRQRSAKLTTRGRRSSWFRPVFRLAFVTSGPALRHLRESEVRAWTNRA